MEIMRSGTQGSQKGPADWFTGTVRIDSLFPVAEPSRTAANTVTFEPGARTAWHTHPLGQMLIVTFGVGRVQREGGEVEEIRAGDVVRFARGHRFLPLRRTRPEMTFSMICGHSAAHAPRGE